MTGDASGGNAGSFSLRVDCGAAAGHIDAAGNAWVADVGWDTAGNVVAPATIAIDGTNDGWIYQTARAGMTGYTLPVPSGTYTVRLHFAEIEYEGPSQRLMEAAVEGQRLPHLDVLVTAGGARRALVEEFRGVAVTDHALHIQFVDKGGGTTVSGIEVVPDEPVSAPETLVLYPPPAGTPPFADFDVSISGSPVFVHQAKASTETSYVAVPHDNTYELSGFVSFDFCGEVTLDITPNGRTFQSVEVRPSWKGVTPRVVGNHIFLTLHEPRNLSVELDGTGTSRCSSSPIRPRSIRPPRARPA